MSSWRVLCGEGWLRPHSSNCAADGEGKKTLLGTFSLIQTQENLSLPPNALNHVWGRRKGGGGGRAAPNGSAGMSSCWLAAWQGLCHSDDALHCSLACWS